MKINFNKVLFNKKYIKSISLAFENALKILKIKCIDLEVNISFISKREIKYLNNKFRNKDMVTDVLSFPNLLEQNKTNMQLIIDKLDKNNFKNEIDPETNLLFLGDICICKAVAFKHARQYKNSYLREIVYMAVHGFLHLIGYDHLKNDDKKIMREVEEKIMCSINLRRD